MEAWTDERLDDLAASLRPLPAEMAKLSERMEAEFGRLSQLTQSNTEELRLVRQDLSSLHRLVAQIGWGFGLALLVALIGLSASAL